ncbi:MAG: autotransporter outer membrane beta-barrel domain-containing protein [Alphaproteobacteria bacterium]|nr:autotransporter outer membrane beta-barrel domain-containing protein [Alphaproteobacteria bacterium]MBU1516221.1 autotransporter outer membrane beta-barrel domain-containing protein [Alphaproteobacteria bacterium]MBU2095758.1 autotransporter outer membrane beta-barrel domain-containing protein [Alphaproteobacteria bacterium]MBU2154043.1 autotransporter outer membrane beta-barrel domain-containing protein [Alphaproteobacteria bacterium]MBU2306843.1 autotransporter outer membrane beta-barrel d
MKRLLVSTALLPLLYAASAHAETKISTATTAPVKTSTIAAGQADHLTIDAAGSIAPTVAGPAVTIDTSNAVINNGAITFTGVNGATGVLVNSGVAMALANNGTINVVEDYTATDADSDGDLDGPFAQGSNRFGIRVLSPGAIGNITNGGSITVEGNDSAAISIEGRLTGNLTSSGGVAVVGDRSVGIRADSVSGDVKILGAVQSQGEGTVGVQLGSVDGAVVLQGAISNTGYRSADRLADAARAKLDADDLKQGGGAVRITGNVGKGILLDRPPLDSSTTDTDEDKDGIPDAAEGIAAIASYGAAPAIDIGGASAITIGAAGTGDLAYGFINRGSVTGNGVNDGIAGVALRIGQVGGGTVTVQGGISNIAGATIVGRSYLAQSTAVLLNANAVVPVFRNAGSVGAEQNGGLHDARAIVDLSGTLALVENSGVIRAVVNPATGVTQTGKTIAIDLSANTTGAVIRQAKVNTTDTPAIGGDILFGSGNDRLELLGGTFAGTINFGAGADSLILDGGATAAGRIVDSDGRLSIDVRDGRLTMGNLETVTITSLNLGAKGVLAVTIDPTVTNTRLNVTGAATVATGAQVDVTLASISRGSKSFQIVQAQSLTVGQAGATLAGAPYLYNAALRADAAAGALYVDIRPKTATELGLNRSGSQAYDAVFASLDKDDAIEQAFLGQKTQAGFQGLYDQMLPDHSGGVLMSASAISSAVSSAVAQPMAIDRASGTGMWAQEVAFNIRQDKQDAAGFKSQGFGFAAGMDLQGEAAALGANVSFVTTDVKDRGAAANEQISMNLFGAGLYWRLDGGPLQAAVRGGVGYAFFDGDRRLESPTLSLRADAKWNAWMADAYAGVSYEARIGNFYARPELSASYLRLAEDGYKETGGGAGFNLIVDKRTADMLTGEALLALGWRFGDEVYFAPEIKAGYRGKLAGGPGSTTAHFDGGADFTLDPENVFKGGAVVRAGFRGGGARVLYAVNGGATMDKDYKEYDLRATVRFQF